MSDSIYALATGPEDAYALLHAGEHFIILGDGNGKLHGVPMPPNPGARERLANKICQCSPLKTMPVNSLRFDFVVTPENVFVPPPVPKLLRKILWRFWHYDASVPQPSAHIERRSVYLRAFQVRDSSGKIGATGYAAYDAESAIWLTYNIQEYSV